MLWAWRTFAVVFASLWVWAFYREDRNREPLWLVAWIFILGALAFIPARLTEYLVVEYTVLQGHSVAERAGLALLVAGPVEEICKLMAVLLFAYRRRAIDEPMDGIVYAAAAAAGFALAENLHFMVDVPAIILLRGPGGTLLHILFAGFWGVALGQAAGMRDRSAARRRILLGVLMGTLAHGVFNTITYAAGPELDPTVVRILALGIILPCFLWLRSHMKEAQPAMVRAQAA